MGDLNVQKGFDPNASWLNTNVDAEANKVEKAKALNKEVYVSTIVKSDQEQQAQQLHQASAEAGNPKLLPQDANASDPSAALAKLLSPQNIIIKGTTILNTLNNQDIPGASQEDIELYKDVPVSDPEIQQLAEKLDLPPALVLKNMQKQYNFTFEQSLGGVPTDEAQQLLFAHYFPENATYLSPHLKALLNKLNQEACKNMNAAYGLKSDWQPPTDNAEFAEQLGAEFANKFDELLRQYPGLKDRDVATLRTMLLMDGAAPPDSEELKEIFNQLKQDAAAFMQGKYGMPADFPITVNKEAYNQMLQGAFSMDVSDKLARVVPPLTEEQKAQIEKYLENPDLDLSMPPALKALAEQIKARALADIQIKFGLPPTWVPGTIKLKFPAIEAKCQQLAQKSLAQAKEAFSIISGMLGFTEPPEEGDSQDIKTIKNFTKSFNLGNPSVVLSPLGEEEATQTGDGGTVDQKGQISLDGILKGPERQSYIDFLKIIGETIIKVEHMVNSIQGANVVSAKGMTSVRLEMAMNAIEKQRKALEEMKEKKDKQASVGPLSDILDWTTKGMILALGAVMGPPTCGMSLTLAVAFVADGGLAKVRGEDSFYKQLFNESTEATGSDIGGVILTLALVAMLTGGNPLLLASLLEDSRVIQSGVKVCGGNQMAQEITAMVVVLMIQITVMVAMIACTGGFNAPATIAPTIANVAHISEKTAMLVAKILAIIFDVVMMSIQVSTKAVSINNHILQAQIAIIKGKNEAYQEEIQALMQMLKKLIDRLLDILNGHSDWLLELTTFQQQKYTKVSEITTELAS